ncbi:MAG: hypothetical protein KDB90_10200 [Planctomycetes bacterium]|nr:hypothetical protein [Planctomycetota bacterium]
MQTRFLIAALATLGLLVLAAVWQLNTDKPQSKAVKPRVVSGANIDEPRDGGNPLRGDATDKPVLDDITAPVGSSSTKSAISPPPPAPLVENDPAKGKVWLRLLDSRTNHPLVEANCELWHLPFNEGWWQRELVAYRTTDRDGLLGLSAGLVTEDNEDEVWDDFEKHAWEVCLFYGGVEWITIPTPRGWQFAGDLDEVTRQVEALLEQGRSEPIDIAVVPNSTLRISARDQWGAPLPNARIECSALLSGMPGDLWFSMQPGDLEGQWEQGWSEYIDEFRRDQTRDGVICTLERSEDEPGPDFSTDLELDRKYGSLFLKDLPPLKIGAMAWDPVYGFGEATVQLMPGSNELNVYLKPTNTCSVKLRIEWLDEEPAGEQLPYLQIVRTGPYGRNSSLEDHDEDYGTGWDLKKSETGVWVGEIHNLPPGFWWLSVEFGSGYDGTALFQLAPFESRSVTLYAGEGAAAHWKPIIQSGGLQLECSSLRILGGSENQPCEFTIYHDTESGETDSLDLAAGTYTVWIPTLQPFALTLKPGETRSDVYELLSTSIRFTIDSDLAELLSPENREVMLNLYPEDGWEEAEDHLHALDARLRKLDEQYDVLTPGITRSWAVPPAQYRWELQGGSETLQGHLEITATGPTSITFGLNSLPGRALLEIDLAGFAEDTEVVLEFESDTLADTAVAAMRPNAWDEVTNDYSGYLEDGYYTDVLRSADDKRVYAFSSRGSRQLRVYAGNADAWFRVNFPGRMTIRPYDLEEKAEGEITLASKDPDADDDPGIDYHVIVYHESGDYGMYGGNDTVEMPLGKITLMITRDEFEKPADRRYSFASVPATITREQQKLRLDQLTYRAYGQVSLTFKGRGSPDGPFDAWWYDEDGLKPPVVLALEQQVGGSPRYVHLAQPDRLMPNGELAFVYENRLLPPGRYKVIPWRDAAEKWCVTFEVKPGESTSVVVQGGK